MKKMYGSIDELFENVNFTDDEEEEIMLEVDIINELIKARKKSKKTQSQISRETGIPQSTIARIETRAVNPHISTVIKYLNAIDCRLKVVHK